MGEESPRSGLPSKNEIERRYKNVRSRMDQEGLDALLVCGNQYAGFEGAVFYMSGFEIVHRYVYVLLPLQLVPFDTQFDMARAVKSEEELAEVRDAMDIILDGFWALVGAYCPGKTEAEIMAPAVARFFARGAGPRMMNILLSGSNGEAEAFFKVPGHRMVEAGDLLLYSLEITGVGGYWVEFSRPLLRGKPSSTTQRMADAYPVALEEARKLMRAGELASNVHRVVAETFSKHGFTLGHLSGHSIGATMLEYPAIGAKSEVPLEENMIFSLHPQVVDRDGKVCLYTQDTYRVGKSTGECLASVPWKFFTGQETPQSVTR